jgi:hypothetical protein
MANAEVGRSERERSMERDRNYDGNRNRDDGELKMITSTETRRSLVTSEFWLTLLAAVVIVIAGYWDDANLRVSLAWSLAAGILAAYILSRGIAKAGSKDPDIRTIR